jgi:hypothetical protein
MAAENRLGILRRRCPAGDWPVVSPVASAFRPLAVQPPEGPFDSEAHDIGHGAFRPFSWAARQLGFPPKWNVNLLSGSTLPADRHWTELPDFDFGDIKGVWELSRWFWAYPLGRAYLRTKDEIHTRRFLELALDWMDKNPPNLGPNWKCGQEASIRLMAAAWALSAFDKSPLLTPEIRRRFASLALVTARRVEAHLGYALSQDNNHGICELAGLVTVGCLWPDLPGARKAKSLALGKLDGYAERLFAADGSFSQHSSNYHRVALDALCWTEAVLRVDGRHLPPSAASSAERGARFLHALSSADGLVARYGADDGARILPLTCSQYGDFRPTLAACSALLRGPGVPDGPWQDQARMLGTQPRPGALEGAPAISDLPEGGIHVRRIGRTLVTFRCPTFFRFRPSHADHLHVSVLHGDELSIEDPGTLSYNLPEQPWADLASARFHNVPLVDDRDAMERATRFLWLPWLTCDLESCSPEKIMASHRGHAGFVVRRTVEISREQVVITDRFEGDRMADLSVRWSSPRKADLIPLEISTMEGVLAEEWHGSDHATGLGVNCLRYGSPGPGWMRIARLKARSATIVTRIALPGGR